MRNYFLKSFLFAVVAGIAFVGCKKEVPLDTDLSVALDNGIAEGSFQEILAIVSQQAVMNGLTGYTSTLYGKIAEDCPTVTLSEAIGTFPNTMTIDFGDECTSYLGLKRSGKIFAHFTGFYKDEATIITVTTEDYFVNDNKVEGTKYVTNEGVNDAGNIYFTIYVADGVITLATGEIITWTSSRTREWIEGSESFEIEDDVYSISNGPFAEHSASGINRNGTPFTVDISTPLVKRMDCDWLTQGVIEITPEGFTTRVIDFGGGVCDNEATLSIGEFVTYFTLPY